MMMAVLLDTLYDPLVYEIKHWLMSNCSDRGRLEEVVQLFLKKLELFSYEHAGEKLEEWDLVLKLQDLLNDTITELKPKYLTPYDHDKGELTVEAKISFKAMLDFILFVEQLYHVNRGFYAASRAVTAIDDMVRILDEWLIEGRPSEELPKEYEYLVRWFKWWAEGERAKHNEDMELNGLQVLYIIRDKMVNYFESRWGKRIVEYGAGAMFIYSKDKSYINRIRTKKHGYAHSPVERRQMREEYGINETDLKFLIETEENMP
jgi:hypothetical protein